MKMLGNSQTLFRKQQNKIMPFMQKNMVNLKTSGEWYDLNVYTVLTCDEVEYECIFLSSYKPIIVEHK